MRMRFWEQTYTHKKSMHNASLSDVKFIKRKLNCAQLNGFWSPPCKCWLIINVLVISYCNYFIVNVYKRAPVNVQILYLRMASYKNCLDGHIDVSGAVECGLYVYISMRLLRTWHGAKHFSTSKTVYVIVNISVDFNICTL